MKKTGLTFGLIGGAIMATMMFATLPFADKIGFDKGAIVGYTTMIVAFMLVFYAVPLLSMLSRGFLEPAPTFENYARLSGDRVFAQVIWVTARTACVGSSARIPISTACCIKARNPWRSAFAVLGLSARAAMSLTTCSRCSSAARMPLTRWLPVPISMKVAGVVTPLRSG